MFPESTLTAAEWWAEFDANACCPDRHYAALVHCGCGGSGQLPTHISPLLLAYRIGEPA